MAFSYVFFRKWGKSFAMSPNLYNFADYSKKANDYGQT